MLPRVMAVMQKMKQTKSVKLMKVMVERRADGHSNWMRCEFSGCCLQLAVRA